MKSRLFYFLFILMFLIGFTVLGQNSSWNKLKNIDNKEGVKRLGLDKDKVFAFELNMPTLLNNVSSASFRSSLKKDNETIIKVPGRGGDLESFSISKTSVLSEEAAIKYPNIQSFVGKSVDNPGTRLRMTVYPGGVKTMITYGDGRTFYMEPNIKNTNKYILYESRSSSSIENSFSCKTISALKSTTGKTSSSKVNEGGANDQTLRKFRIAISTTAEYTNYHNDFDDTNGDAVADAVAAIVTTLGRVNEVFETDMAITFEYQPADQLIYTNPATDPYTEITYDANGNSIGDDDWNLQLQNVLQVNLGNESYDVGHLFAFGVNGGDAGCIGCVCSDLTKGSAYTSSGYAPEGDEFDINYVAHEIGHQMGANHTFAFDDEGYGVSSEPGSGTTIMGYAGLTGNDDVQYYSDPYFHYHSINQILTNLTTQTCWQANSTIGDITNNPPIANAGNDYTIPHGTAYYLDGSESLDFEDMAGLTYCWEQIDSGMVDYNNFGPDLVTGSMNRSRPPSSSAKRYIPAMVNILNGDLSPNYEWETVYTPPSGSTVGRTLNWALTVRDNEGKMSQSSFDTMTITVDGNNGPFSINLPVKDAAFLSGETMDVQWDVANTNLAPFNSPNVNILLSLDNGVTYPLALNAVPNDGFHQIVVPVGYASQARIKIESVGNIFFAISEPFKIKEEPNCGEGYTCIPDIKFEETLIYNYHDSESGWEFNNPNNSYDFIRDGRVLTADIEGITEIELSGGITDFSGIEDFTSLEWLECSYNNMQTLDLSKNKALQYFRSDSNPNLEEVIINDVTTLTTFRCLENDNLKKIDLSGATGLISALAYRNMNLNNIDVSDSSLLETLEVFESNISFLDIRNNVSLTYFRISDSNLNGLNLKNGNNSILSIIATGNPNLECIQADDVTWPNPYDSIDPQSYYSLDCSNVWTVYIPDLLLENAIRANYLSVIDTNNDGKITFAEAGAYTGVLDLSNSGITDITGLNAFTSITSLNLAGNNITNGVDLFKDNTTVSGKQGEFKSVANAGFSGLQILDLSYNSIENLDLSSITTLTYLDVSNNQLTSLDVKNGSNNILTSFNSSNNLGLGCINVDNEASANAGTGTYSSWNKDSGTSYSESCQTTLGIENLTDQSFSLYPNPTEDKIFIVAKDGHEILNVKIYSISGKLILEQTKDLNQINVAHLAKGMYFLNLVSDKGSIIKKIIKK